MAADIYKTLFESMDEGFCIMQMLFDQAGRAVDYRFVLTNATFERHTGLKDAQGRTARELVPDLDDFWFERYGHVARTGEVSRFEQHAPAMHRWFDVTATRVGPVEDALVALVFRDISARRLAEVALEESEARFRNMADHAPVMMWVTDESGACIYLNKPWYDFTGQSEASAIGFGWLGAVHPSDSARASAAFVEANARHASFQVDYRLRRHDGEYRWAIDAASPRFDAQGVFRGYVGSVIDIEVRKAAELARETLLSESQRAREAAEEAIRLKDEFLALVSHELRTPLSAVLGWAQLLRSGNLSDERRAQGLEVIERNARAQAQLIDDLLDVSRILAGKLKLELQPVSLAKVVEDAVDTVRPAADAKSVSLQLLIDSTVVCLGDSGRLTQTVWNLLTNAVKFTGKGGRIRIVVRKDASTAVVEVADNGTGVSAEFLPFVFERFRQEQSGAARQYGGLGLGLSIVRQLVEMHGGTVHAASAGANLGATFSLRIPIAIVADEHVAHASVSDTVRDSESPNELMGMKILVVDDEPDARGMMRTLLESSGAEVVTASSADEGLAAFDTHRFHIAISDIGMPGRDGYDFIRALRARKPEDGGSVPAIALTAYTRVQDRTRALRSGFQNHVAKPVEPHELFAVVIALTR